MARRRDRHDDIRRLLARAADGDQGIPALAAALDALNAPGFLEEAQKRLPASLLCFGPKLTQGAGWAGVVIWHRPPGYYAYHTLGLAGVWASGNLSTIEIIAGTRSLTYNEQPYNPESYFYQIKRGFELYYGNDPGPPEGASRFFSEIYDPSQRLPLREALRGALRRWTDLYKQR